MSVKRIGMFGGSFDPPHHAHAALIEVAVTQLQLDELKVVPTGDAWHKTRQLSPASDRLAMAMLAFAHLTRVVVDPRETQRLGPSYSLDTLQALKAENPQSELFLVMGGDQARALPTWHRWQLISQLAIICVAEREDSTGTSTLLSSPNVPDHRLMRLKMPLSTTSASKIRTRIANHEDIVPLVGEPVARYIASHHLYQTA